MNVKLNCMKTFMRNTRHTHYLVCKYSNRLLFAFSLLIQPKPVPLVFPEGSERWEGCLPATIDSQNLHTECKQQVAKHRIQEPRFMGSKPSFIRCDLLVPQLPHGGLLQCAHAMVLYLSHRAYDIAYPHRLANINMPIHHSEHSLEHPETLS